MFNRILLFFFPLAQDLNVLDKTLDTELCPTSRLLNGQSLIWWNSCLIPALSSQSLHENLTAFSFGGLLACTLLEMKNLNTK